MDTIRLPNTDITISRLGLGTWAIGSDFYGEVSESDAIATIHAALDSGVTLIDTAPVYGSGRAEEIVGRAIKDRRDEYVVATKCGNKRTATGFERIFSPEFLREEIEGQLKRLGTDTIDLYFIHWPDATRPLEPGMEELQRLHQAGKFRYLCLSNFTIDLINQVREFMPVVCMQPQYSILKPEIEADILPYCEEHAIGVMSYGTLAGGILTGKFREIPNFGEGDFRSRFYKFFEEPTWSQVQAIVDVLRSIAKARNCSPAEVAINWALFKPVVSSVLVGAKRPDQIQANAAARDWAMTEQEYSAINDAVQAQLSS